MNLDKTNMTTEDVVDFYNLMSNNEIDIWIDGGFSVDALLGKQLREHKDLDIAVQWKDVPKLREILEEQGYKQVQEDSKWNFVLVDSRDRAIDVHAFIFDDQKNVVDGISYPTDSLKGTGMLNGLQVQCISPEYVVEFLAEWVHKWPEKYISAISELCEKFNIELPQEYLEVTKIGD